MSMINTMQSWFEHEKEYITSVGAPHACSETVFTQNISKDRPGQTSAIQICMLLNMESGQGLHFDIHLLPLTLPVNTT